MTSDEGRDAGGARSGGAPAHYGDALTAYAGGALDEAARHLREALAAESGHAPSLHLAAVVTHRTEGAGAALALYRRAVARDPTAAEYLGNLAVALGETGEHDEAVECYRRALRIDPGQVNVRVNLGNALRARGDTAAAAECYEQALEARPDHAKAWLNLGNTRLDQGDTRAAVTCFERSARCAPGNAAAHRNLGFAWLLLGDVDASIREYRRATELEPDFAQAHCMLGAVLMLRGRDGEALACFDRALRAQPGYPDALRYRGAALGEIGRVSDAVASMRELVAARPDDARALAGLGDAHKARGEVTEALACLRRAVAIDPHDAAIASNLLLLLNCDPAVSGDDVLAAHRQWGARHAAPAPARVATHANPRDEARRLRVGYVSADLRAHPVGYFLQPVLEAHDRERFDIVCYSNSQQVDAVTADVRRLCDEWHDITPLSASAASARIRDDRIDILVDLMGHSSHHRLATFALRPAPVQVTWLGYPNSTGLDAMDYVIADAVTVPQGAQRGFSERVLRMPGCLWCYRGLAGAPGVAPPPAPDRGHVTFGCFNHPAKLSAGVIEAWGAILDEVTDARLVLKFSAYADAGVRSLVLDRLAAAGVAPGRVDLRPSSANPGYLESYRDVDIALDPFPYSGGTITCDALWMGVPVVTLAGDRMPGRLAASMLSAVGLPELIATTRDEYVRLAIALARDLARTASLRAGMRERVARSPLGDTVGFTRELESAFRGMWRHWCRDAGPGSGR